MKKWDVDTLGKTLKVNVKDYSSAIAVAALFKYIYGVFPKIGLSGAQAEMANSLIKVMPKAIHKI